MTRATAVRLIEFTDCYMSKSCRDYGERNHDALMMGAKALKDLDEVQKLLNPDIDNELALERIRELVYYGHN